ncbi:VRR-NUC domain-containing protein [Sulfurimonas sp. NWX79]|uniref:VRR-NUC domain-containing protein n=1 Tax=Sulfurimonas sp. NWX79 TaxID=2925412 RepID=UPI003204D46E
MNEQQIQKKIIDYLKSIGAYTVKTIVTNSSGTPDLLMSFKGHFIAIEVKAAKGRVSELQKWHLEQVRKSGGIAFVAKSVDEVKLGLFKAGLIEEH